MISTVVFVFGIASSIGWDVAKNHPDWTYTKSGDPRQDSYLEGGSSIMGILAQTLLTDVEFQIYVGLVTWTTVVVAGWA